MSWFKTGYEAADHAYDDIGDSQGPRRVWMPPETTNRYIFLDDEPFCFHEHQFQANGSWKNYEPCKIRNRMEATCAVCDRYPDRRSSFIGYHTVTNLTPWTSKKSGTTYCYGREMFGAKLGGKDNPGALKEIQRLRDKHGGRTRGLVIDAFRSGAKTSSVGDKFEVVDKIEPDAIVAWVKNQIVDHLAQINKGREPEKVITMEKFLSWNPIEPFDFEEIIKPRTNAQLLSILGGGSLQSENGHDSSNGDSSALDEDCPY